MDIEQLTKAVEREYNRLKDLEKREAIQLVKVVKSVLNDQSRYYLCVQGGRIEFLNTDANGMNCRHS